MQTNQKGFSVIEIVLIVVVIGLIGAVAWLFVHNSSKTNESTNTVTSTKNTEVKENQQEQPAEEKPELAWYTYTPIGKQYSIKVPDGWTLHKKSDDDTSLYSNSSLAIQKGTLGKVVNTVGNIANCGHVVLDFLPYTKKEQWSDTLTTDSGLTVQKIAGKDEIGVSGGGMSYSYNATKGQRTIYINYNTCAGGPDYHDVVEQAVKTLSIN